MLELTSRSAEEARGLSVVLDACAGALLNEPSASVVDDIRRVATAIGAAAPNLGCDEARLLQRYHDRFFVVASPVYVPCQESCVRGSAVEDGVRRYGATSSAHGDHVLRCYKALGFDWRALQGCDLAKRTLKPDAMAVELAFVAYVKAQEASAADDEARAGQCARLAAQFVREHAGVWIPLAADLLAERSDDFYAGVVALASAALAAVR